MGLTNLKGIELELTQFNGNNLAEVRSKIEARWAEEKKQGKKLSYTTFVKVVTSTASSFVRYSSNFTSTSEGEYPSYFYYTIIVEEPTSGSFVAGQEIRVDGTGDAFLAKITSVKPIQKLVLSAPYEETEKSSGSKVAPTGPNFSLSDYVNETDVGINFTPDIATTALKKATSDISSFGSLESIKETLANSLKSNISEITGQATNIIGGFADSALAGVNEAISGVTSEITGAVGGLTSSAGSAVVGAVGDVTDLFGVNPKFAAALEKKLNKKLSSISESIQNKVKDTITEKLSSLQVEQILSTALNTPVNEISKLQSAVFARIDEIKDKIPDERDLEKILNDVMGDKVPDFVKDLLKDGIKDATEAAIEEIGLLAFSGEEGSTTKTITDVFGSTDLRPDLTFTSSSVETDVSRNPSVFVDPDLIAVRENPVDPYSLGGLSIPNDRHRTNIANEPVTKYEGEYPYNKSYRSESGHLIEIDDTPGKERLLDQHVSGTYVEMQPDGDLVTKVVRDGYTVVCGSDTVTIEGSALVHVAGDCNLRVGGYLTITADKGINISTKGDFRLKAKSINMESSSGDISARAANNMLLTAVETFDMKSKKNHIQTIQETSIKTGENFILESKRVSQYSDTDMILQANKEMNISANKDLSLVSKEKINSAAIGNYNIKTDGEILATSKGDYNIKTDANFLASSGSDFNIKSGGKVIATGTTMEVDATLNAKGTTNLQGVDPQGGTVTPITGQGASAASDPEVAATAAIYKPDVFVAPKESLGSGITYIENPALFLEVNDDDLDASLIAMKEALTKNIITKEQLDTQPNFGETNTKPPSGEREVILQNPNVKVSNTNNIDNLRLSSNYTVGQLSKFTNYASYSIIPQKGLTVEQIVQNLQLVAQNCLEKIKVKYPDMIVTCGFRQGSGSSQHLLGQAIDMQFSNHKKTDYFEIASWIKDNVPYDELLLEYKSTGTGLPWIHISFKQTNNRSRVRTFFNGAERSVGLVQMA